MFEEDNTRISQSGRLASSALQVYVILQKQLLISAPYVTKVVDISMPTAYVAIQHLRRWE